jgi:dihydrofolate synthase/folylpolyglutamate synthase
MLRSLLPRLDRVVFTRASNPRSLPTGTLETLATQLGGPPAETASDPRAAVARARELAGPDGAVVATGSIYLIADLVREPGVARASTL